MPRVKRPAGSVRRIELPWDEAQRFTLQFETLVRPVPNAAFIR